MLASAGQSAEWRNSPTEVSIRYEKIPPVDMELAIQLDPLFEQILIFGEAKPYLSAVTVLNDDEWARVAAANQLNLNINPDRNQGGAGQADGNASDKDKDRDRDRDRNKNRDRAEKFLVQRIAKQIKDFPGYAQVRKITIAPEKWTIDNGLMTPTLKLKRVVIFKKYASAIEAMYKGHT